MAEVFHLGRLWRFTAHCHARCGAHEVGVELAFEMEDFVGIGYPHYLARGLCSEVAMTKSKTKVAAI
jgi:hypothetical protein